MVVAVLVPPAEVGGWAPMGVEALYHLVVVVVQLSLLHCCRLVVVAVHPIQSCC